MSEFPWKDQTHAILGACFEVYRQKGCGFLEAVYQECLAIEFGLRQIPFAAQPLLRLEYKGHPLRQTYQPDFVCFDAVLVEVKAVSALADEHRAQLLNYLHATGLPVGLLVNFGHHPGLEYERFVHGPRAHSPQNTQKE
ncbi:GxxExxY protein [Limisphaera sp. VF-2]|jgi:GxxExxY protein|uniref:GxxExxY protein n=1 Tax=Limisphaera sp. VF-2 TaxID=3400418 RepID=UPI0017598216